MFASTVETMGQVQRYLGLSTPFPAAALKHARNQNKEKSRSRPSRHLNTTLDGECHVAMTQDFKRRLLLQLTLSCGLLTGARSNSAPLAAFFAPYNEELYAWAAVRKLSFARWENATQHRRRI